MSVSHKWFGRKSSPSRRFRRVGIETLEPRQLLSAGPELVNTLGDVTLFSDSPLHIPLDGYDSDGLPVTFRVDISNNTAELTATPTDSNNRSMKISVPGYGDMVFELFEDRVPRVTNQIITLAEDGLYDGLIFHRVIDDFMIQGGDPNGDGSGGSSLPDFDDQFHIDLQHNRGGLLSLAKSTDDTNNSQFFITELATRHLDYNHSIFGLLIEGDDVREAISEVAVNGSTPVTPVVMESVEIYYDNQNATLMLKAPPNTTGGADITITIIDDDGTEYVQPSFHVTVVPDVTPGLGPNQVERLNANPYLADIDTVYTTVGTEVKFPLSYIDADGPFIFTDAEGETTTNPPYFYDAYGQYYEIYGQGISGIDIQAVSHVDLEYEVNRYTGEVTVTPKNDLVGLHVVSVAVTPSFVEIYEVWNEDEQKFDEYKKKLGLDAQLVPVIIQPADLEPVSKLEMSIVQTPTATDAFGEIEQLPENVDWMDEWESFSVEIWASTKDTTEFGIHTASFDLTYNTDYYTAVKIEYGDMFNQDRTGTIIDGEGKVNNIGGRTPMYALTKTPGDFSRDPRNIEKFGDDKRVLVARVNFVPNATGGGVPLVTNDGYPLPVQDLGLTIENAQVGWNVAETTTVDVGDAPDDVDVWPMLYDNDESGKVDLGDLAYFAAAYRTDVGEMPDGLAWKMDYDRSGTVDLGDLSFFAANYRKSATSSGSASYPSGFPENWPPAVVAMMATTMASMTTPPMTAAPGESTSGQSPSVETNETNETKLGFALAQSQQPAKSTGDSSDKTASIIDLLMRTEGF